MPKIELITDSDEGRHSWMTIDELKNTPSENGMSDRYLPIFLNDKYNEAFGPWDLSDDKWKIIYK